MGVRVFEESLAVDACEFGNDGFAVFESARAAFVFAALSEPILVRDLFSSALAPFDDWGCLEDLSDFEEVEVNEGRVLSVTQLGDVI